MDWNFQQLKYGWYALIGVLVTGTTIYVASNQRNQVQQVDIIELILGVQERCLATQTSTNPISYLVAPLSYVSVYKDTNYNYAGKIYAGEQWIIKAVCYTTYWPNATARVVSFTNYLTDNMGLYVTWAASYSTTGGYTWVTNRTWPSVDEWGLYLNRQDVTNLIGWHPDRKLLIELDEKIKALVPHYVDANTVYDGTTNVGMLTVTSLWASLGIGDRTNQFTRTPCWTNSISTNWVVNYTSFWPSTNGVATNIVYTSDYRKVVNYAQSWTATGGHVWVASSNWASSVMQTTNNSTYGDYPWQIYVEDLQERYKVLNALHLRPISDGLVSTTNFSYFSNINEADFSGYADAFTNSGHLFYGTEDFGMADGTEYDFYCDNRSVSQPPDNSISLGKAVAFGSWPGRTYSTRQGAMRIVFQPSSYHSSNPTSLWQSMSFAIDFKAPSNRLKIVNCFFSAWNGLSPGVDVSHLVKDIVVNYNDSSASVSATISRIIGGLHEVTDNKIAFDFYPIVTFPFQYCTNKYW